MTDDAIRFYAWVRVAFAGRPEARMSTREEHGTITLRIRELFREVVAPAGTGTRYWPAKQVVVDATLGYWYCAGEREMDKLAREIRRRWDRELRDLHPIQVAQLVP
jgi:hypothetical protein